ncbi:hypothetical protein Tco_0687124, partial [Tanacetum coccineum]
KAKQSLYSNKFGTTTATMTVCTKVANWPSRVFSAGMEDSAEIDESAGMEDGEGGVETEEG